MSLNKLLILVNILVFITPLCYSQQKKITKDTLKVEVLEEVVLTGQHHVQSVNKSIFEVKVIGEKEIEQRAAVNLADLLNQTLNLNITPNTSTGKSGVSLFGLDAQYFKIVIDNVPVINEEGLGNNVDLNLINLDDVQQIEIVEGSMGVQYGANAISGVINIITKKGSRYKSQIKAYIQEETVGNEYEWFDKGKHIQSIKIGHNFTDALFGNVSYTRNDFAGFWNQRQGKVYDKNDNLRGHEWLPKEQHNIKFLLNYKKERFSAFYKFDYFNETINDYNSVVNLNENTETATSNPSALDEVYTNNRFIHHINSSGYLSKNINFNVSVSYQQQKKEVENYTYYIRKDKKENVLKSEYLTRKAFFSRGTFSNLIYTEYFKLQAGYEITKEKGTGSPLAIYIEDGADHVSNTLENYDAFLSSEIELNKRFSLRPGARISFTNLFKNQYMFSLSSKYLFKNNVELRTVIGSANRTPSYDELYTYLVNINHDIQGNTHLNPERGMSAFIHLKKQYSLANNNIHIKNKISVLYFDVQDRIELVVVETSPLAYQYNNIDAFKSRGLSTENIFQFKQFKVQLGASILGVSKILDRSITSKDDFLYNFQLNSNINYLFRKSNTSLSLYYKYTGKQHLFVEETNAEGEQEYVKRTTDAFSWFDVTLKQSFFHKKLETTLGVRNILDISSVETTAFSGGAHSDTPTSTPLAYGRSYFFKLAYNLNL